MLKKLKIGGKITFGFTVVIVLMLVISVVVFSANSKTKRTNVTVLQASEMQTKSNDLKTVFYSAQINSTAYFSSFDDNDYNSTIKDVDDSLALAKDLHDSINDIPAFSEYEQYIIDFENNVQEWKSKIENIKNKHEAIDENNDSAIEIGHAMAAVSTMVYDRQFAELKQSDYNELDEDEIEMAYRALDVAQSIVRNIDKLQLIDIQMRETSLTSQYYDDFVAEANETGVLIERIVEYNPSEVTVDNTAIILSAVEPFVSCAAEYAALADEMQNAFNQAKPVGEKTLVVISTLADKLDELMIHEIGLTTSSVDFASIIVIIVSLISLLLAIILAVIIINGITKPIQALVTAADSIALGDATVDMPYRSKDEIGSLAHSFRMVMAGIRNQVSAVDRLAHGDLSADIEPRSDKDTMALALVDMVNNLNNMFVDINTVSSQVLMGANQIADGSQAVASGTNQQASAIEELSVSISEVAKKTQKSAEMAEQAAELGSTIKDYAEKSTEQMRNMITAVHDINEASNSINKVIKVIDDIAFQTNILALNAAVESARAGQHGKGFAVVAQEVRNLASKSAAAAKDTSNLIADSIEKAKLGTFIAKETAQSLEDIVTSINKSSAIVSDIAVSSREQSMSIAQINVGIDSVTKVVQQNSATSGQLATAAEGMSSQSDMLQSLVAQFTLKEGSDTETLYLPDAQ